MSDASTSTDHLQHCLDRMRQGDAAARDELLRRVSGRLERLARKMLKGYPGVRRWAETGDVLQNALLRLLRALDAVQPATPRDFFALAATQVRRELLDLARHYYGPEGIGAHHATPAPAASSPAIDQADASHDPAALAEWFELHRQIGALPDDERAVVGLLYYQGLTQASAAAVLNVTVRTVQRRWQAALLKLHRVLKGEWPGA